MPSEATAKPTLRARFRALRRARMAENATAIETAIRAAAGEVLATLQQPERHLGLYWPIADEPDLRPLAHSVPQPLALPAVANGQLLYRRWRDGERLQPDACGIPAPLGPEALRAEQLSALLVPALAFDQQGFRLGYGAGWFDRLRGEPAWRAVPALAVLPATCLVERLPVDPWDVPFDGWLDENGLHWLQPV